MIPRMRRGTIISIGSPTCTVDLATSGVGVPAGWIGDQPQVGDEVWVAMVGGTAFVVGLVSHQTGWASYTPTLTGITLGNGSINGRWMRDARKKVTFSIRLVAGSTTTGTGALVVGLPSTIASPANSVGWAFSARIRDVTPSTNYSATGKSNPGDSVISATTYQNTSVTGINPFTVASGDGYDWSGTYEEV